MLLPGGRGGGGWGAKAAMGEYERGLNPPLIRGPRHFFLKIHVSENAFQAILKAIFPYSLTSIFSKVFM